MGARRHGSRSGSRGRLDESHVQRRSLTGLYSDRTRDRHVAGPAEGHLIRPRREFERQRSPSYCPRVELHCHPNGRGLHGHRLDRRGPGRRGFLRGRGRPLGRRSLRRGGRCGGPSWCLGCRLEPGHPPGEQLLRAQQFGPHRHGDLLHRGNPRAHRGHEAQAHHEHREGNQCCDTSPKEMGWRPKTNPDPRGRRGTL